MLYFIIMCSWYYVSVVSSPCSLAVEELLEDGDDDSLGLGLGDKVYTGVKLSGEICKILNLVFLVYLELYL